MNETILGKISSVAFGTKDGRIGLRLTLSGEYAVQESIVCWDPQEVQISEHTKWTEEDRDKDLVKIMRKISELLQQAKINNINSLLNIPVEITFNEGMLKSWRILEEVL